MRQSIANLKPSKNRILCAFAAGSVLLAAACGSGQPEPPTETSMTASPGPSKTESAKPVKDAAELNRLDQARQISEAARKRICRRTFEGLYKGDADATPQETNDPRGSDTKVVVVSVNLGDRAIVSAAYGNYEAGRKLREIDCQEDQTIALFKSSEQRKRDTYGFNDIARSSVVFNEDQLNVVNQLKLTELFDVPAKTVLPADDSTNYFSQDNLRSYQTAIKFADKQLS